MWPEQQAVVALRVVVLAPTVGAAGHWSPRAMRLYSGSHSFLQSEVPPSNCTRILGSGEAAAQIAEVAKTHGFDLMVMQTHAGRFRSMLLGSTTAKVLNDADCPVMTTVHAERIAPRPLEPCAWVCAIGLSADSERVPRVTGRAATSGRRLEQLVERVECASDVRIVAGPVKEGLLNATRRAAADAPIVGKRPPGGVFGRLRDLTYGLVRDAPFPVLSV